ncbi:HPP family protein [Nocardioides caricicola]|uniref:HPP family protein n=1 Tax=Nocardioides caricicola TaxID=634770 RepID=A0ABW0N602_9ACTN
MLVRDLMTPGPATVRPSAHLKEALTTLARLGITSLPVVDDHGRVCGIVSEADLIREAVARDPRAPEHPVTVEPLFQPRTVEDVYTRVAASVRVDDDVADAVETMVAISAKSLPVLDEHGRLVGILSRSDVVRALARADEAIAADIDQLLASLGRADWLVEVDEGVAEISGPDGPAERSLAYVAARTVAGVVEVRVD